MPYLFCTQSASFMNRILYTLGTALSVIILLFLLLNGCKNNAKPKDNNPVARVNSSYLYRSDIEGLGKGLSGEDSARQVQLYIDKWAVDQLVLDMANKKLNSKESAKIERLIESYRNSLTIAAYEQQLVDSELDTVVTAVQLAEYYKENQDQYISGHNWVRCHFIKAKRSLPGIDNLRNWFKSESKADFEKVKQYCLSKEGINFVLDSDQWVNLDKIGEMLPEKIVDPSKLQPDRSYDRTDDEYIYLFRVYEIRDRNNPVPLTQVQDEIFKIVLHQRRNEILQKLRKTATEKGKSGKVFEKF